MGSNSLIILPAGFDPYKSFRSFTSLGMIHNAGTPLILTAGQGFGGQGSINDSVIGEGTIAATPGGGINLNNGLFLAGNGNVSLGTGNLTVMDTASGMNGGRLQASNMYVNGVFTQSGGTTIANSLSVGGTYSLSGNARLSAGTENIDWIFQQTGGSNVTSLLSNGGSYLLSGGTLNIQGGFVNKGTFNGSGGSASLFASSSIIDLSHGTLTKTGSISVTIDANSVLIVPLGFNPATVFGSFNSQGIVHVAGTPLDVSTGRTVGGQGTINDPVTCEGTILASPSGSINLGSGLYVSGSGVVDLGQGSMSANNSASGIVSGSLSLGTLTVGTNTRTIFSQSGGLVSTLITYVGPYGVFNQSGGTHSISGAAEFSTENFSGGYSLWIGGTYTLSGNSLLSAVTTTCSGTLIQSGGTQICSNGLNLLGGLYTMSGDSVLSVGGGVALDSAGTLAQSGGTVSISGFGELSVLDSKSLYSLNGGILVLGYLEGGGLIDLNGGTLEANASFTTNFPLALGKPAGNATVDPAGYTIGLSGSLSGPGNLVESGGGTLILSGTNTYIGGTTVSDGTLIVASSEGLADGSSLLVGNVAEFASIVPADAPAIGSSPASVPEPGTLTLFAIAIVWIGCRRRRN